MSKGKFASLIMLGAFSAGIASSSAVSAQGNESLASVTGVNGIGTHDDSVSVVSKVSSEPAIADDETKIDTEVTTDKEVQTVSSENKTNLPENSDKDNKNEDYVFFDKTKKAKRIKKKKTKVSKIPAKTAGGAIAIGSAAFGISKLAKPFGKNDKKDDPSKSTTPKPDNPNNPSKATTPKPDNPNNPSKATTPKPDNPNNPSKATTSKPDNPNDPSKDTTSKSDNPNDPSKATTPKPDIPSDPSKATTPKPDNPNNPSKATTSKPDNPNNPSKATTPKPDIPSDPSKDTTSKSDNPNDPSKVTTPKPDIPSDPKKEEKDPEKKEGKDEKPSQPSNEEEKGGFTTWYKNNLGASIPLTILSIYLIQFIIRMIIFEVKQRIEFKAEGYSKGAIFFSIGKGEESSNIKPFFGLCEDFTDGNRFKVSFNTTDPYYGLKRVAMNALAAATLAKYDWHVTGLSGDYLSGELSEEISQPQWTH